MRIYTEGGKNMDIITEEILKKFDKTDLELINDILDMKQPLIADDEFNDNHQDKKGVDLEE